MTDTGLSILHNLPLVFTATLDSDSAFVLKCILLGKSFNLSDPQFPHQYRTITSECLCPLNWHAKILTPKVMVLGGRAFVR